MQCPNKKCGYVGFSPLGICPKCKERLLPDPPLYSEPVKQDSVLRRMGHFLGQLIGRSIDTAVVSGLAYLLLWVLVYGYNVLSNEIPTWSPIDFYSQTLLYLKWGFFALILVVIFRSRWHSRWR